MKRSNECTKPKGATLKKITSTTKKLFNAFHPKMLAEKSGIPYATVRAQKTRLKLSQEAATKICSIPEVAQAGFTREQLRPDILVWFDAE